MSIHAPAFVYVLCVLEAPRSQQNYYISIQFLWAFCFNGYMMLLVAVKKVSVPPQKYTHINSEKCHSSLYQNVCLPFAIKGAI